MFVTVRSTTRTRSLGQPTVVALLAIALAAGILVTRSAAPEPTSGIGAVDDPIGVTPVVACADLLSETLFNPLGGTDLSQIPEAPARILSATEVAASADHQSYCQLNGYIWPQIQFEIRLPIMTWNGRYLQTGCGGFCGDIPIDRCGDALALNFAVGAEDSGHVGGDGLWGRGNELARIDFGYRSPHALAVLAKEIMAIYYGQGPAHSYYRGCSMGGRQAFMNAQHYPGPQATSMA